MSLFRSPLFVYFVTFCEVGLAVAAVFYWVSYFVQWDNEKQILWCIVAISAGSRIGSSWTFAYEQQQKAEKGITS